MPTIRGHVDQVSKHLLDIRWMHVKTLLPGGGESQIPVMVTHQTLIARGTERVDLSSLREGESVEVTYHCGRSGLIEAETIYVRSDEVSVAEQTE